MGILWNELFNTYKIKIHFAHRTFKWGNEAKGNAAVHVVIIGFSNVDVSEKRIYEYEDIKGEPHELKAKNINPYLVEGKDIFVSKRRTPICKVSEMVFGNMPNDGVTFCFLKMKKMSLLNRNRNQKNISESLSAHRSLSTVPSDGVYGLKMQIQMN